MPRAIPDATSSSKCLLPIVPLFIIRLCTGEEWNAEHCGVRGRLLQFRGSVCSEHLFWARANLVYTLFCCRPCTGATACLVSIWGILSASAAPGLWVWVYRTNFQLQPFWKHLHAVNNAVVIRSCVIVLLLLRWQDAIVGRKDRVLHVVP